MTVQDVIDNIVPSVLIVDIRNCTAMDYTGMKTRSMAYQIAPSLSP